MRKYLLVILVIISITSSNLFADVVAPHKKWTFLIYLNGNNSLDSFGFENIKAMEKVGSSDDLNIVVQWASLSKRKVVRLLVEKSDDPQKVTSKIIQNLHQVDMGDYRTLQNFIDWGVKQYPADHYFIDVWNHGSGWRFNGGDPSDKYRLDISSDEITGNKITTEQLGLAMAHAKEVIGHNVDIYGSDACLMAMVEVANEMYNSVDYFVGSEEVEPGAGWPYAAFLEKWTAQPEATPKEIATMLAKAYTDFYRGGKGRYAETTFSGYDLQHLPKLNVALTVLGTNIQTINASNRSKLIDAIKDSTNFYLHDYVDIGDIMRKIYRTGAGVHRKYIADVKNAIKDLVFVNKTSFFYKKASGISLWVPMNYEDYRDRSERYKHLKFNERTQWINTLDFLLQGVHSTTLTPIYSARSAVIGSNLDAMNAG